MKNNILNEEKLARSEKEDIDDESSDGDSSSDNGEFDIFFVIKTIHTNLIMFSVFFD